MNSREDYEACRRMWAAVLATNTKDAIAFEIRKLEYKRKISEGVIPQPKPPQMQENQATREWIASKHFLEVCRLAGMGDGSELQRRILDRTTTVEDCRRLLNQIKESKRPKLALGKEGY